MERIINVITISKDGIVNCVESFITTGFDGIELEANKSAIESAIRLGLGEDEYFRVIEEDIPQYEELKEMYLKEVGSGYVDCGNDGSVQIVDSHA